MNRYIRHWTRAIGLESTIQLHYYACAICQKVSNDKNSLVEHLGADHEILEIASFAADTMMGEQERDGVAREFHKEFEQIRKEIAGSITG
jgi:hypothetical protein